MARLNRRLALLGLSALLPAALALPEGLGKRTAGQCGQSSCQAALAALGSQARLDCSSFLATTVTPCAATSTPVVTVTVFETATGTAATDTALVTATVTGSVETDVRTVLYTTTVATDDVPTTVATASVQDTVTVPATADVTDIVTVYQTATKAVYDFSGVKPVKRSDGDGDGDGPPRRVRRGCKACPYTRVATAVPSYASACADAAQYSSVCFCMGVTPTVVTLSPSASTTVVTATVTNSVPPVTVTDTAFVSVTDTTTVDATVDVPVTYTNVVPVTATFTQDPATLTLTTTQTVAATAVVTNTVPGPTQYCEMYLQIRGSSYDGRFIYNAVNQATNVISTSMKTPYRLDKNGKLHPASGPYAGYTLYSYGASSYVNVQTDENIAKSGYNPLTCKVNLDTLEIFCQAYSSPKTWVWSNGYTTADGPYLWLNTFVQTGSTQFRLFAVPVNCVT
ncbi:uncharacterized protein UV8b_00024 [Ustilaginoidea virens]|uniref:Uncharacterized protein n=1 Tax=Ustilaginoidea virens TaxID=1159556 RepID=A0A8E5MD86_USTVR|nr:uncharacterized protein UV8b_00024 [Ustilaginoidea virens]QUC15783.1 hypothetical protein UV8b_00024 [Ustilaginoidea virens]